MNDQNEKFTLEIQTTDKKCPIGETTGKENLKNNKIPVLSCEGACIRGEIARLAANFVAKENLYRRACHGELFSVPDSAMAHWVKAMKEVVIIDGCFLRCHGRILENLIEKDDKMLQFDALSHYKKYTDRFDIDSVPEDERKAVAREVANWVLENINRR